MNAATIGDSLKEARAKKSLTLDEVHAKIKVHPRVLQLLEEGKFDKLPSPLFTKSFLRSYADFLEVNAEEVLSAYENDGEAKKNPEQAFFIKSIDEKQEETFAHKNTLRVALLVAALVVAALAVSLATKPVSGLAQKIRGWASPSKLHGPARTAAGKKTAPEAGKKELKNPEEWVRSLAQGNFPKISKKIPLELRLRALDNVWVRVTSDGKVLYQGILGRNAVQTWTAQETLELWTGNAANMFLSVNRYSLGSPGHGMIRRMIITREGLSIPSPENH